VSLIQELPAVEIPGHRASGLGSDDHPMRVMTRRAAGLVPGGWDAEARGQEVAAVLPGEWRGVASRAGEGSWCALRRA
jgi:hypothetical protein